ncbi:MAG TPA: DUF4124 domain-containing protein [Burkholderiales bacterium]|jgi:hypothetical protein|nr:DUF4124 domain-containing protein [Burkholderiales bacterium]
MNPARMPKRHLASLLSFAVISLPTYAQIYECLDQNGNKRFTNIVAEAKGCKALNLPGNAPPSTPAAQPGVKPQAKAAPLATPANFPRVDPQTQQSRDNDRRRILENELANEQKLLDEARRKLAEQESVRLGTERNYQRVLDRIEPFQKDVKRHEDNVANIKREMSNMR